ncbi:hypothetical protein [Alishewanella longhuensis]
MMTLTSFRLQGAKLDQVLLILASMVVLIDWLNGLLWHTWGASYSLAAIFKAVLLAGITVRGWQLCQKQLLAPLGLMLFMLLGPLYVSWLTGQHFLWHKLLCKRWPLKSRHSSPLAKAERLYSQC